MLIRAADYTLTLREQIALAEQNLKIFEAAGAITEAGKLRKRLARLRKEQANGRFQRRRKPRDVGWL